MSNPQTGRRKVKKSGISIGTLLFWGFIGWFWFGDSISEFIDDLTKTSAVVTVNGEKKVIDVDKLVDEAVKKAESIVVSVKEEKPEEPKPKDEEMIATEENDDRYGDYEQRW